MRIEILGMGCPKCKKLYENALAALKNVGKEAEVVKVEDLAKIGEYGIAMTPALAIDGKVKVAGRIPDITEIQKMVVG